MTVSFQQQRLNMVNGQLRTTDITDVSVLEAFEAVPREIFVPSRWRACAYADVPIALDHDGRELIAPAPLAKLIQLAQIRPGDLVLEVGCGSGYASAIIAQMQATVIAIDSNADFISIATQNLSRLGYDAASVIEGTPGDGYAKEAPYDVIVIAQAIPEVPDALLDQLKSGGKLVMFEPQNGVVVGCRYENNDGVVGKRAYFDAAVPLAPGFESVDEFAF